MSLTKDQIRNLRSQLQPILTKMEKSVGFKLRLGNATFSDDNVTFKLECDRIGKNGQAETKEAAAFRHLAKEYGLSPADLGRKLRSNGSTYIVVGLLPKSYKFPILVRRTDGKMFKFPAERVANSLKHGFNSVSIPEDDE